MGYTFCGRLTFKISSQVPLTFGLFWPVCILVKFGGWYFKLKVTKVESPKVLIPIYVRLVLCKLHMGMPMSEKKISRVKTARSWFPSPPYPAVGTPKSKQFSTWEPRLSCHAVWVGKPDWSDCQKSTPPGAMADI